MSIFFSVFHFFSVTPTYFPFVFHFFYFFFVTLQPKTIKHFLYNKHEETAEEGAGLGLRSLEDWTGRRV